MSTFHAPRAAMDAPGLREYTASGGDWAEIAEEAERVGEERIVVNMGPVHPSTHGVLRLEVSVPDADPHLPSVVEVYPGNDWQERETWDLFGIVFDGHPALTRTAMPDDWIGHPQRKDYPLGGIPVEYKGATVPPPDQRREYK